MSGAVGKRLVGLDEIRQDVFAEYRKKTPASQACSRRASLSLAGGVTGNLRYFLPYPLYQAYGQGAKVYDLDGNEYLDCFLCNGPLLLGHNHPAVVAAVDKHKKTGSLVVNPESIVEAAELLQEIVPCAERIRFLSSGTEAVLTAARYARAYTGKSKVVKFYGHYHGQDDQFLIGLEPTGEKFGAGIPDEAVSNTILASYGDVRALEQIIEQHPGIAAVMLDPAMHAGGLWGSSKAYLQSVRDITSQKGIVLIFDEVITGFRLALGGAQDFYGITPDLATFAKALAAGEKLAAVAGKEKIMRVVDSRAPADTPQVFQSGTANDGTTAIAAAIAAMNAYRALHENDQYARLFGLGDRLADGIREVFTSRDVPCHVNHVGPLLQVFLADGEPGFERFSAIDMAALSLFFLALINEGVVLTLPGSNHIYLSFVHAADDIDLIIEKTNLVLDKYDFSSLM